MGAGPYLLTGAVLIGAVYALPATAAPGLRLPTRWLNVDRPEVAALLAAGQRVGTIGLLIAAMAIVQAITRRSCRR